MDNNFFGNGEGRETEILRIEFGKFIKHSSHIVREVCTPGEEVNRSGEVYLIRMIDVVYGYGFISENVRNQCYSGELEYEEIVFLLLEVFINNDSFFSGILETERVSKTIAFKNYTVLGNMLGKNIVSLGDNPENNVTKLLEDKRTSGEKLIAPLLEVLSILIEQSHKKWSKNFDNNHATMLDDFLNLLGDVRIIDQEALVEAISTNDIDRTLYNILKKMIFGNIIPHTSYLYECFLEFETLYRKRAFHILTQIISDETIATLDIGINPKLIASIFKAFHEHEAKIFDRNELIEYLKEGNFVTEKEESYLRIIESHRDFLYYLRMILKNNTLFLSQLSPEDEIKLWNCFYAFSSQYGELYGYSPDSQKKDDIETLIYNSFELIEILLHDDIEALTDEYLDEFLSHLEKIIPHKPFYMRILHIEFDELKEIPSPFHKAIQILGILVCDVLNDSHPLYEDATELLLCNTRSESNHAAIKNIFAKSEIEKGIPKRSVKQKNLIGEKLSEPQKQQLIFWMKEIITILEAGALNNEGEYISQFYAFLIQNKIFSPQELQDLLEAGDDMQNIFGILDTIFLKNRHGNFQDEMLELLHTYLYILSQAEEHQRYKKLSDFFGYE